MVSETLWPNWSLQVEREDERDRTLAEVPRGFPGRLVFWPFLAERDEDIPGRCPCFAEVALKMFVHVGLTLRRIMKYHSLYHPLEVTLIDVFQRQAAPAPPINGTVNGSAVNGSAGPSATVAVASWMSIGWWPWCENLWGLEKLLGFASCFFDVVFSKLLQTWSWFISLLDSTMSALTPFKVEVFKNIFHRKQSNRLFEPHILYQNCLYGHQRRKISRQHPLVLVLAPIFAAVPLPLCEATCVAPMFVVFIPGGSPAQNTLVDMEIEKKFI